jgi:glycosyltransferase involved in cell wall biosynthesis
VILHERNRGKGAALRTALARATGELAIIQDADLEYDPADYPGLLAPLLDGRADAVYGSRFLGGPHRVLFFWHYFGNWLFTLLTNVLYNINLTDMGTCYKVFLTEKIKAVPLESERFGIEAEITAKICKRHLRLYEVPISYSGRTYDQGKKITWKDGFSYLFCLLRYRVMD